MKFHSDRHPPPFLNRRDQYLLLAMVALLCIVIVAVKWAARPSSWYWLVPPEGAAGPAAPSLEELDFRVQPQDHEPLPPDTFRAVADPGDADEASRTTGGGPDFVRAGISANLLATIDDNTLGLRRREADAYHAMLSLAAQLPEHDAASLARNDVAFTVLMQYPDEYRGQLLNVTGDLRRLTELPASEESGFNTLYEGWLFTRDSGTNPYRIVFTQIPAGVTLGESLNPPLPVRLTGYFFKRYGYVSRGGQHVAPMLIARTLSPIPPPVPTPADGPELRYTMIALISVIAAGVLTLAVWFFASDRRFRRSRLQQLAAARLDADPADLAALQHTKVHDPTRPFAD